MKHGDVNETKILTNEKIPSRQRHSCFQITLRDAIKSHNYCEDLYEIIFHVVVYTLIHWGGRAAIVQSFIINNAAGKASLNDTYLHATQNIERKE